METTLEPPSSGQILTRRRALGLAVGAGAAVAFAGVAPTAPAGAEAGRSPGFLATPARVLASDGTAVAAEALDEAQTAPEPWAAVPVAGFPWGLVPRTGDHVAVTDGFEGLALAAVPLCGWVDGVPARTGEGFAVGDHQTVAVAAILGDPAAALVAAANEGRAVSVCLGDTDLATALVLQVRNPGPPASGSPGS